MTEWTARTADEIVERFRRAGDPFGWERETIIRYLTWDEAKGMASDTPEEWAEFSRPRTIQAIRADALTYAAYTYGRVLAHRNNEAQRSMYKLDYWCWLLGSDRLAYAPDDFDERGPYCMRSIRAAVEFLGGTWPPAAYREHTNSAPIPLTEAQQARLQRMADGKPCTLMCDDGCRFDHDTKGATSWS